MVKEIAPDLSVVGTAPLEGVVVNRKSELAGDAFVVTELYRIKRLSQGIRQEKYGWGTELRKGVTPSLLVLDRFEGGRCNIRNSLPWCACI